MEADYYLRRRTWGENPGGMNRSHDEYEFTWIDSNGKADR